MFFLKYFLISLEDIFRLQRVKLRVEEMNDEWQGIYK